MKKKGFTLIELLVVIAIIAMLLAILMPALSKVKKIAQRVICGTNLKGLGTAQMVYANDYDDRYVQQKYNGTTAATISDRSASWDLPAYNFNTGGRLSIGASLYLLVREADVSPKSFVCPASAEVAFDGKNAANLDLTELYDFGHPNVDAGGPVRHQSYAYHNPYNRFAADGSRGSAFAVMADKNPYHDAKLQFGDVLPDNWPDRSGPLFDDWVRALPSKFHILKANAQPHGREGQNVMFGDGHNEFARRPDVGVRHDNIYTVYASANETGIRQGKVPPVNGGGDVGGGVQDLPGGQNDSYLVNDSQGVRP